MNGSTGAAVASLPLAHIENAMGKRADRYSAVHFAAFLIGDMGKGAQQRTYALDAIDVASLDEALVAVLAGRQVIDHKDHVLIRETGPLGVKLHLYAIKKQSAPIYVWRDHRQVREHRLYAAPLCVIDAGVVA